jgi:hypothetical protein
MPQAGRQKRWRQRSQDRAALEPTPVPDPAPASGPKPGARSQRGKVEGLEYQRLASREYAVYAYGELVGRVWKDGKRWIVAPGDSLMPMYSGRSRHAAVIDMLIGEGWDR